MVTKKTWQEFRSTGLMVTINQLLHIFGWAIVPEMEGDKVISAYPARVKFRGFDEASISKSHKDLAKYLKENIDELEKEANL